MNILAVNITDRKYNYGKFIIEDSKVVDNRNDEAVQFQTNNPKVNKKEKKLKLDSAFINYLISELTISKFYTIHFRKKWTTDCINTLTLILIPTRYNLIDYNWNERVYVMVRERCELDHALSWLSTLGGAFSALGDYFAVCADTAGKISIHQLKLALRLGDPNIAARCRLYLSLSLIQKKKFKFARKIVSNEFHLAKQATVVDPRLLNMCRGIWSKLQYEYIIIRKKDDVLSTRMKYNVI